MAYNSNTALTTSTTYSNVVSSSEPVPAGFHRMPDGSLMYGDEHTKGFNYTSGDVFLNTDNSNYIGYYNYTGNSVWTGRRKNDDSNEIFARDNILGIYNSERVLFSRGSEEILKLRHQKEKILFDPGEFINEKSINLKLKMLYENYLDLSFSRQGQDVRYALNDDKLRALGWEPKEKFDEILPNIVKYYKKNFIW